MVSVGFVFATTLPPLSGEVNPSETRRVAACTTSRPRSGGDAASGCRLLPFDSEPTQPVSLIGNAPPEQRTGEIVVKHGGYVFDRNAILGRPGAALPVEEGLSDETMRAPEEGTVDGWPNSHLDEVKRKLVADP